MDRQPVSQRRDVAAGPGGWLADVPPDRIAVPDGPGRRPCDAAIPVRGAAGRSHSRPVGPEEDDRGRRGLPGVHYERAGGPARLRRAADLDDIRLHPEHRRVLGAIRACARLRHSGRRAEAGPDERLRVERAGLQRDAPGDSRHGRAADGLDRAGGPRCSTGLPSTWSRRSR